MHLSTIHVLQRTWIIDLAFGESTFSNKFLEVVQVFYSRSKKCRSSISTTGEHSKVVQKIVIDYRWTTIRGVRYVTVSGKQGVVAKIRPKKF